MNKSDDKGSVTPYIQFPGCHVKLSSSTQGFIPFSYSQNPLTPSHTSPFTSNRKTQKIRNRDASSNAHPHQTSLSPEREKQGPMPPRQTSRVLHQTPARMPQPSGHRMSHRRRLQSLQGGVSHSPPPLVLSYQKSIKANKSVFLQAGSTRARRSSTPRG